MSAKLRFNPTAIGMELLPVAVQLLGIGALLFFASGDGFYSVAGCVLALIWIKTSQNKLPEQFGEMRLHRRLFASIGTWLNNPEAEQLYDRAQSEFLMIDGSIENDEYAAVVTAAGIANAVRTVVSFGVSCYLLFVVGRAVYVLL